MNGACPSERPPSPSSATTEDATIWDRVLAVARHHARRFGISADDVEDCAMDFVERMLDKDRRATYLTLPLDHRDAWLHRCAMNHACNFSRGLSRRRHREVPWPAACEVDQDEAFLPRELVDDSPGP